MNDLKCVIFGTLMLVVFGVYGCHAKDNASEGDYIPLEQVVISEPPAYEVPVKPKRQIGDDGVWEADSETLFGFARPKGAKILECDAQRYCEFSMPLMSKSQLIAFIDKYYPYQKLNRYPAIDTFEILPEIKEEFLEDGIVPSFDRLIFKPAEDEASSITIAWSKKENCYVWRCRSGLVLKEERLASEKTLREANDRQDAVILKLLEAGNTRVLTPEELNEVNLDRMPIDSDGNLMPGAVESLQEMYDAHHAETQGVEDGVPTLKHIVL